MNSKKITKKLLKVFSTVFLLLGTVLCLNAQTTITIQPGEPSVGAGYPFGALDSSLTGFGGFIYRNIPAFTLNPGDKIRFDMGDLNDVDIRRNIYFAQANINPAPWSGFSQGVTPLSWVQVIDESQIPLNSLGDSIIGNFELTYTATASFTFTGGGFIIGFGTTPPGTYIDSVINYDGVYTSSADSSGYFYQRFAFRSHLTMDVLDDIDVGFHDEFGIMGFQIELQDIVTPTANCKNITVYLDADGEATITASDVDNGSTAPAGLASLTVSPDFFSCENMGDNPVTLTITDTNGDTATCIAIVTVADTLAPVAVCNSLTVYLDEDGMGTITVADIEGGSTDNCGIDSYSIDQATVDCSDIGAGTILPDLIISEYIEGSSFNKAIEIYNGTTNSIDLGATGYNLFLSRNGGGSTATIGLTGTIASGGTYIVANSSANAGILALADQTSAPLDFNGNDAIVLRKGLVNIDIFGTIGEDPGLAWVVGGNETLNKTLVRKSTVFVGETSNAPGFPSLGTEWLEYAMDTISNLGSHTITPGVPVTLTVTDVNGNVSTCTSSVTVLDTITPVVVCKNISIYLDSTGLAEIEAADVDGGSSDNCGIDSKTISMEDFTCANIGANPVTLAEADFSGNFSSCIAIVTVLDTIAPVVVCKNISVTLVSGTATITAADVHGESSDNCGITSMTISDSTFTCADIGPNSVTLTVMDASGNVSTCNSTVTVSGVGELPVAVCKNISITLVSGTGTITPADIDDGSTASCGIASMTISDSTFVCADAGPNSVTLIVTDVNGNVDSCTSTVTVVCCVPPVAVCKNISITLVSGTATITPASIDGGSTASCGLASKTINKSIFTCANIGANAVILTVMDVNGNISTCTATVTVVGAIPTVTISQGILPGLCQGGAVVLTANSPGAVSYLWTGGLTTNPINVYASGTYTVGVTNSYGCKKSASASILYNKSNLLSAYTIVATGSTLLGPVATLSSSSKILSGGLGVKSLLQTASVVNGSTVTAAGTFVKAPLINTLLGGSITTKIYAQANVTLPSFKANPYAAGPSLSVPASAIVTINDSIFSSITIGSNAKVTFTRPTIYATGMTMGSGSSIEFSSSCQKVCIKGNFTAGNNCKVNVIGGKAVVVYCTGNLTLGYGNTFKSSAYVKGKLTTNENFFSPSTYSNLTGMYIANSIDAKRTNFNWNSVCGNCGNTFKAGEELAEEGIDDEVIAEENNSVSVYPNPSDGNFKVKISSDELGTIHLMVTNLSGQVLLETQTENSSGSVEMPIDLIGYSDGIYFLRIQIGEKIISRKIILNK